MLPLELEFSPADEPKPLTFEEVPAAEEVLVEEEVSAEEDILPEEPIPPYEAPVAEGRSLPSPSLPPRRQKRKCLFQRSPLPKSRLWKCPCRSCPRSSPRRSWRS